MGCWDETCGITRQPIFCGDPCVMVVFDHTKKCFDGWVTFDGSFDFSFVQEIHKGTYDDYGWLEEVHRDNGDPRMDMPIVFFHQKVWDQCIKMQREKTPGDRKVQELAYLRLGDSLNHPNTLPDHLEEFMHIAQFSYTTRRGLLSAYCFRGCQDRDSVDQRDLILKLSQQLNDKLRRRWDEE